MDPNLEIRKLSPLPLMQLVNILEDGEMWKRLMAIIPKTLQKNKYECDLNENNPPKYTSEHFRLIEQASSNYFNCTQILFDEWGTSGRVRPTLGHLLYLLVKAELFRAAEYVAVDLLKQCKPARPSKGPAALIPTELPEIRSSNQPRRRSSIDERLDAINYPDAAIEVIRSMNNHDVPFSKPKTVPKVVITESPDSERAAPAFKFSVVTQTVPDMMKFSNVTQSQSDMIEFSSTQAQIPILSTLLGSRSTLGSDSVAVNIPRLDMLQDSEVVENSNYSASSGSQSVVGNMPALDFLIGNESSSRSCVSPLPNLSLNTKLPSFTYAQLELATNNFDETPYSASEDRGYFLGAGAFGKVFLARNLVNGKAAVAVKKFILDSVEELHFDDDITRQFRTEVETLCHYKHDNLLSSLGYSCDGATYCLIYEYMSGGSLEHRLKMTDHTKLMWTDRFYVALGTARAISYLHTAEATPFIHRDVKTANILLDCSNKPKLCDFGLVKLLPSGQTTVATRIFGTNAYMSPEGHRGDISVKLDTFSFGVVLLELLTSLPPIETERGDLICHVEQFCEDKIQPLLDQSVGNWMANNRNIAEELYGIAMDCLKSKKIRPTMVDVTERLTNLAQKCI